MKRLATTYVPRGGTPAAGGEGVSPKKRKVEPAERRTYQEKEKGSRGMRLQGRVHRAHALGLKKTLSKNKHLEESEKSLQINRKSRGGKGQRGRAVLQRVTGTKRIERK